MEQLGLTVKKKKRFVMTTGSRHNVAVNLLNREFAPKSKNQVWTTGITYIRTIEGWVYLAVVIDLYFRQVMGWSIDRH
ncbi:MAG: putative transposase, partial [Candidatus Azotimanducaceae bacterium]